VRNQVRLHRDVRRVRRGHRHRAGRDGQDDDPTNQYFLTLDADGTHLSSNFYLRLAGAATKMINGSTGISTTVPDPARRLT